MIEYILLMYNDVTDTFAADDGARWDQYITGLRQTGRFDGGSSIGAGERLKKGAAPRPVNAELTGYIRVRAESLEDAKRFLVGNPVHEAGGTVEVRELPRD